MTTDPNPQNESAPQAKGTAQEIVEPWWIYRGATHPHDGVQQLMQTPPPPWRPSKGQVMVRTEAFEARISDLLAKEDDEALLSDPATSSFFAGTKRGGTYIAELEEKRLVNAALYLRRPLLVTGKPGTGKSSLAYAIAYELALGRVLEWRITSRSNLRDALYRYDAVGRLQEFEYHQRSGDHENRVDGHGKMPDLADIGRYIRLGPLGTAMLPTNRPRVLLIDEIDKSDIDLPNDLLHIFEEGAFDIPELARLARIMRESDDGENASQRSIAVTTDDPGMTADIIDGRVNCHAFPIVIMTSNGERELPAPFLRRCLRLDINQPSEEKLAKIVEQHFADDAKPDMTLVGDFFKRRESGDLATDQLLNAIYLRMNGVNLQASISTKEELIDAILRYLNELGTI